MQPYPVGLSLCMIVKDEERFLGAALASVADVVDEVCVVDTGSTDATIDIARAAGARVRCSPWRDDFAQARNAALAMATRRWIVVLDADERLSAESRDALKAIGREPSGLRGRWLSCRNLTDSTKGSGAMTNALVRIFPNDRRIRYRNAIHEFVALDGCEGGLPADRTSIEIVHHGYLDAVVNERKKADRNLRLSRLAAQREPADPFHQYNLGMALLLTGDQAGAMLALERMRDLTRTSPRGYRVHALTVLADLQAANGDDRAARATIAECLALVPHYSNAHFVHGKILARAGERFEARNAFGRAIAAGAYDRDQFVVDDEIGVWKAHNEIGVTLLHERRYAEALAWFDLAARERPRAQPVVLNQARCLEALGQTAAARSLFAAAFAAYRDATSAVEWINFLFRAGETAAALDAIEAALGFVDASAAVLLLGSAALAHLRDGQLDAARRALGRALATGSGSAGALEAFARHLDAPELVAMLRTVGAAGRACGLRVACAG